MTMIAGQNSFLLRTCLELMYSCVSIPVLVVSNFLQALLAFFGHCSCSLHLSLHFELFFDKFCTLIPFVSFSAGDVLSVVVQSLLSFFSNEDAKAFNDHCVTSLALLLLCKHIGKNALLQGQL